MKISVVSTLYKSKLFLPTFIDEMLKGLDEIHCAEFELVFVNDGSPDDSIQYLLDRKKDIKQIKVVDLSRNFGHHYAIQAGLSYASGDMIFLIDNDLEVDPKEIVSFYKELISDSSLDVVFGFQDERKGRFVERYFGKLFWIILNKMSDIKIPHNILTERLMTRRYVNALLEMKDANLFMGGMMYWVGFKQKGVVVKKGLREGPSTYSVKKRLELMLQAVTSFSGKPLEWLFYTGLFISIFSTFFLLALGIKKAIYQDSVQLGWTSIVAINFLILGVISTFLGVIGIYLFKIFRQVQGRPNYIIRKVYE
jgi:putative glycosyltransferase